MLTIREVRIADHIEEIEAMIQANWAETGFDFDLRLNHTMLVQLQELGAMFAVAAFDGDRLVGYSTAMIGAHTFNPEIICCNSDALYVLPEWRKSSAGARLIVATEHAARARGAVRMLWHTRAGTPLAAAMKKRGYVPADEIVMKRI